MGGPRLIGVSTACILAACLGTLAVLGGGQDGLRAVVRLTARTSLLLFLLAFAASAAYRLRPGPGTRWLLANRRYVGLSFASSHLVHLLAIVAVQVLLGVEAYMGKFAAAGPYATKLPFERPVTVGAAAIRTTHVLVGTALLATTVVLAIRVFRRLPQSDVQQPQRDETSP